MKRILLTGMAGLMLGLCGCSAFRPSTQIVAINVEPADATLIANGMRYNYSPIFIEAARDRDLLLSVYRKGYVPYSRVIGYHFNRTGTLDALGSIFLFPMIGLFSSGAWSLDETNLQIMLLPESAGPAENPAAVPVAEPVDVTVENTVAEPAAAAPAETAENK